MQVGISVIDSQKHEREGAIGIGLGSGIEDKAQWLLGMVRHRLSLGNYA